MLFHISTYLHVFFLPYICMGQKGSLSPGVQSFLYHLNHKSCLQNGASGNSGRVFSTRKARSKANDNVSLVWWLWSGRSWFISRGIISCLSHDSACKCKSRDKSSRWTRFPHITLETELRRRLFFNFCLRSTSFLQPPKIVSLKQSPEFKFRCVFFPSNVAFLSSLWTDLAKILRELWP